VCNLLHLREVAWSVQFSGGRKVTNAEWKVKRWLSSNFGGKKFASLGAALVLALAASSVAETCQSGADLDAGTRTALTTAAMRDYDLIAKGDAASLKQSAIPGLAADFSGIEGKVKESAPALAGVKPVARSPFLLVAEGTADIPRAEFFCGVFGSKGQTKDSAVFTLTNLPPGKYGVVILDAPTSKGSYSVSLILQQLGTDWKLGGLYIKAAQSAGHDSDWYAAKAKDYQSKGQAHIAWLYNVQAISLVSPLPFMSTAVTDKLYEDSQKSQPADFPAEGKSADLPAGGVTYKLTAIFPEVVGNDLDLIVKYSAADVSNSNQTYASNVAVMKALLTKYPELRDAFASVVARAVDPAGRDYGTMLAMKDIK
jgi:hypothetical protein